MDQDIYVIIEHLRGQVLEISYVMLAAARAVARGSGGKVVAFLLGHAAQGLAGDFDADVVLSMDHPLLAEYTPDVYLKALSLYLKEATPRAVLMGHTSIGMDLASGIAARLEVPVISQCQRLEVKDGKLFFISQICGGKIMAEGELPGSTVLLTMVPGGYKPEEGRGTQAPQLTEVAAPDFGSPRIAFCNYIEPEAGDVDISKEQILIAVGRGIQNKDDLGLAEDLAQALGGVVSASRPIIDQGWLPITRLVGKSGKRVRPKVYLAFGISGAPEHVEAITDSRMVIAVNTDPNAPIFNHSKYGTNADLYELIPVLIKHARELKA